MAARSGPFLPKWLQNLHFTPPSAALSAGAMFYDVLPKSASSELDFQARVL